MSQEDFAGHWLADDGELCGFRFVVPEGMKDRYVYLFESDLRHLVECGERDGLVDRVDWQSVPKEAL